MGSVDIPPFMREKMKEKVTSSETDPKKEQETIPPFMKAVKKKDSTPSSQETGGSGSGTPAEQPTTPSAKSTPEATLKRRSELLQKVMQNDLEDWTAVNQKAYQKRIDSGEDYDLVVKEFEDAHTAKVQEIEETFSKFNQAYEKDYTTQSAQLQKQDFEKNRERNPIKSLAKSAWATRYDLLSGTMATYSAAAAGNTDFTGLGSLRPLKQDIEKGLPIGTTQENEKLRKKLAGLMQAQEFQNKGAEEKKYLVNSLDKISDPVDAINWAMSAVGQAGGQIGGTILTGGGTMFMQEMGSIYLDGINKLSEETGMSVEDIIKNKKDDSLTPLIFGTAAAALDMVGAKGVKDAITKGGLMDSLRNRVLELLKVGGKEAITEATQTVLENIGVSRSADKTWGETFKELGSKESLMEIVESAAQGFVGGSGITALGGAARQTPKLVKSTKQFIKEVQAKKIDTKDFQKLEQAAESIQQQADEQESRQETPGPVADGQTDTTGEPAAVPEVEQTEALPVQETTEAQAQTGEEPGPVAEPTREETVRKELDALQESGDIEYSMENGKVKAKALTEKGVEGIKQVMESAKRPETTESVAMAQTEDEKLSGIKKALVPEDKQESTEVEKRTTEQMLLTAKEEVDSGKVNPKAIVDEIATGNARALQANEVAGLVYYKTQLDNKANDLNMQMVDAMESNDMEAMASLQPQLDAINNEIDNYHTMSVKTAYEQSLAFNMRKMLLDNEYNLQSQINKYKVANRGKIDPEVEAKFKKLDEDLKAANAKILALEEKQKNAAAGESLVALRQDLQRKRERRIKAAEARKEKINEFFESLKVKSDPNKLNSITQVIGEAVYNGSLDAIRAAVIAGSDVASAIQAGIDYVKANYKGTDFNPDDFGKLVRPGLESILPKDRETIYKAPTMVDGKMKIPSSIVRDLVESGMTEITEVVDAIHDLVKTDMPEVTKRDVRDAITKYGQTKTLSKDEIDTKLREIKRVGKMISAMEDIQNKKRPLRSGLQRDKPTDQERKMMREIKEGMKTLPVDETEVEQSLKTALDAVKSRLRNQIADLEQQIKTGEKSPKKEGIQYDEEATELKRQRDELKEIIQKIEGKPTLSDEQKIRMATTAVEKQIKDMETRIKNKDVSAKPKGKPTPETPELKVLRDQRDRLKSEYAQLETDMGVTEKKRLEAYKKALKRSAERYQERIDNKDFGPRKKSSPVKEDQEATRLKLERDKIKQQFDMEQEKARLGNRPMSEKVWDTFMDILGMPKSFLASLDMSAPFRQGAILTISNPKAGAAAFKEMFRQTFSEKNANEWLLKLRETPLYGLIQQSKLYVAEPSARLSAKEESFMSNWAAKIPIIGQLVKGSERAYTGYLNKLRVDIFANGADRMMEQGITPENNPEAYKSWANFVNNATGRGNLGGMERSAVVLNNLFFSPRYLASRFNLINPVSYAKMPPPVRKMALKSMVAYIGFTALVLSLLDLDDDLNVEWDPRSSDFGKVRWRNTRFDPWAGFQQVVRFLVQLATGERKNTKTGEITKMDGKSFPFETRADLVLRFGRSKLAPSASIAADILSGQTMVGEEVTLESELLRSTIPLYMQDMGEIYQEEGVTGLLKSTVPAFFGIGVQSYGGNSGFKNKEFDPEGKIQEMNKKMEYSFSQPGQADLKHSFEHDVDDETYDEYYKIREQKVSQLMNRYNFRLKAVEDIGIYDRMVDNIAREADRHAKYTIAKKNGWDKSKFDPGNPFVMHAYKRDKSGKIVMKK